MSAENIIWLIVFTLIIIGIISFSIFSKVPGPFYRYGISIVLIIIILIFMMFTDLISK